MNIGFIGLGIMGSPMVENLLKGGETVYVNDVNEAAIHKLLPLGAIAAKNYEDLAENCELIILMLPNAPIIKTVLFGEKGLANFLRPGTIVVDMSSLSPVDTKEIYEKLQVQQVKYLDAPVSGGQPKAVDGTLSIMVGGCEQALQKVKEALQHMAGDIVYVGESGSGSTTKLANQILVNVTIAALSEAAVLASKAGVDLNKLHAAIRNGLAGSAVLDAKLPLIIDRNFVAGGRIDINLKDLNNVAQTGEQLGVALPLTTSVIDMFEKLKEDGKVAEDHCGLVQYYEKVSNYEIPKGGK